MPRPRKCLISLDATPYYHCTSRCVRKAFLCGGQYEYRREWIEERILELTSIFAIDVAAYAIMSNHYHVVLHINSQLARTWTDKQVCLQWHKLFKGSLLSQSFVNGKSLNVNELEILKNVIGIWRRRLADISWFMRCVNEPLARMANIEDHCSGRFWEGRFSSQALLDEKALAACMAYVDLNPVRAKIAETPEASDHTSIQKRIITRAINGSRQPEELLSFVGNPRETMPEGLPFQLDDYLELVEFTGRAMREDKRGSISNSLPPILSRLDIELKHWLFMSRNFESRFKSLVGSCYSIKKTFHSFGYTRSPALAYCRGVFG